MLKLNLVKAVLSKDRKVLNWPPQCPEESILKGRVSHLFRDWQLPLVGGSSFSEKDNTFFCKLNNLKNIIFLDKLYLWKRG